MNLEPVPITKEKHLNTRIKQTGTVEHIAKMHMAPVYTFEFPEASVHYPILFTKTAEGRFMPILLWGTTPEKNKYIVDGKWTGGFVPSVLKIYPFVVNNTKEDGKYALGVYENSELVNEIDGERILTDDGKKTEWFNNIVKGIEYVVEQERLSKQYIEKIEACELFVSQELKFIPKGKSETIIGGFYGIDKNKFQELPIDILEEWRDIGLLNVIYSHFSSLYNLDKLLNVKS